jgi:hypothetical protein
MAINASYGPMPSNANRLAFGRQVQNTNQHDDTESNVDSDLSSTSKQSVLQDLSSKDQEKVDAGLDQWMPTRSPKPSTPITSLLADPTKQAFLSAIITALVSFSLARLMCGTRNKGIAAVMTAGLAVIAGASAYSSREKHNENLLKVIKKLSPDATQQDMSNLAHKANNKDI